MQGYAFTLDFDFTADAISLPKDVIIGAAYDTNNYGATPIGTPGPYISLNVSVNAASPTVGADPEPDAVFWNTSSAANYSDGGAGGVGIFRRDDNWSPYTPVFKVQATPCTNVTNMNTGETFCTIQEGIDDGHTLDGHTLSISAGTYAEHVTVTKQLKLDGAGAGTDPMTATILDGSGLGAGSGIHVNNGVTDVTIQNLTVQNYTLANPNQAGVVGFGGNNNFTLQNAQVLNNNGGRGGVYLNGPVDTVLIDNVTAHNNQGRGIVIWNGAKTHIAITNNDIQGTNCCGIELQDGTASGVTMTGNTVVSNGDSGMSAIGLTSGAGPNVISGNTVTNNGRFGIEIKNPDGTGLDTGDGSIVIENNTVSITPSPAMNNRDHAGIAVFRRSFIAGNPTGYVDVPNGVVVRNNTVSGYDQQNATATASEGFGIVVEGVNHTVTGNTLNNNDVGIQEQGGNHANANYVPNDAGDGDQADGQSPAYFGRGNAPVACGNTISGNNFSGNTTDFRQNVAGSGGGVVTNTDTGKVFCSIQAAIDDSDTLDSHTITVGAGIYAELLDVNKEVALIGAGVSDVTIDASAFGDYSIEVTRSNVTLSGFTLLGNPSGTYGIKVSGASPAQLSGITIQNVKVDSSKRTGIDLNGVTSATIDNVEVTNVPGGNGIALSDSSNINVTNVTTSNNAWGGLAIYTLGQYFPLGSDNITIGGTNSFGEANKVYVEVGNYSNPAAPAPVTNLTVGGFEYIVRNDTFRAGAPNFTFYQPTQAAAIAYALGLPTPADSYANKVADGTFWVGTDGTNDMKIQAAVDHVNGTNYVPLPVSNEINVLAGDYEENVTVDKHVKILGAGSTVSDTVLRKASNSALFTLSGSGASPADPLLFQDIRLEPVGVRGFNAPTGVGMLENIKLDNVMVIGTNPTNDIESEVGLWIEREVTVNNLEVVDSAFDNLIYGWYFQKQVDAAATDNVTNVTVSGTSFSNNDAKGLYIEKLSDAQFNDITVANNGINTGFYNAAWNGGLDLNLKGPAAYQNITIQGSTFTTNGLAAKEGAALMLKARDDGGTYGANPATLDNIALIGNTIDGNERGIRFGEPGKTNNGPTNVVVQYNNITNNAQTYAGADGSEYGGVINQSLSEVNAALNWWNDASGPSGDGPGSGDAVASVNAGVLYCPWLGAPYVAGDPVVTGNTVTNLDTLEVFCSIQAAIDDSDTDDGDVLEASAGIFIENVTVHKGVILQGQGNGNDSVVDTIVTAPSGNVFNITAGGASVGERLTIQTLRVDGADNGLYTDSTINFITLDNLVVDGASNYGVEIHNAASVTDLVVTRSTFSNNGTGMRVRGALNGLDVDMSHFDSNNIGFISVADTATGNNFTDIEITNSSFNNNGDKGIYVEKFDNALLDAIEVLESGSNTGYSSRGAVDINLKYGDYTAITLSNSTVTNTAPQGRIAVALKARDDGSYSSNPATLTGLLVDNVTISGSITGILLGDAGNATPTSAVVQNSAIEAARGVSVYSLAGALIDNNNITVNIDDPAFFPLGYEAGVTVGSSAATTLLKNTIINSTSSTDSSGVLVTPDILGRGNAVIGDVTDIAQSNDISGFLRGIRVFGDASIKGNIGSIDGNTTGILVENGGTTEIRYNDIENNDTGVQFASGSTSAEFACNNLVSNTTDADNLTGGTVDATYNYWDSMPATTGDTTVNPRLASQATVDCENDIVLGVTIGYFHATRSGDGVDFVWQTATESGVAGFTLYAELDDEMAVLTTEMIPSVVIDSITPTGYYYRATTAATLFYLDEQKLDGSVIQHGPFVLDEVYGDYALPGNIDLQPTQFLPLVWEK
ncbi:MAG: right-handed parallel beta-helix repeat-containing protein [Caldilineaceae bacterium]|nr:right-handed parallel beta-helix repeat-containing protein [Caldilineaceae bacterium]